ncbi:carbohydrate ABC transporter permease [Dactylosporangium roseum]
MLHGTGPIRRLGVALMWLIVLANVAGLVWMVLQAFRDTRSILASPWELPHAASVENFVQAWTVSDFATATWNSTWVTVVSSVLTVAVAAPAAYYLSRQESRLSRGLTLFFVLGLGVPAQVILIPLFVMLNSVHLVDSLIGLNLIYIGLSMPFTVFLLTGFFRSLPMELEEAAALDGASPTGVFWRVMLPVAKGGILTAFVLQLIGHWNETLLALTFLQSTENYTLPVALISFVQQQTYSGADWGGLFAGLCIIVIPMLAVYVWLGRRLTEGLTLGMGK